MEEQRIAQDSPVWREAERSALGAVGTNLFWSQTSFSSSRVRSAGLLPQGGDVPLSDSDSLLTTASRDSGTSSLSPGENRSTPRYGSCPHSSLPACRRRTSMLQSFAWGEGDLVHLSNHRNTQTGVLGRLFWGPHVAWSCRTSSLHG